MFTSLCQNDNDGSSGPSAGVVKLEWLVGRVSALQVER